MAAVPELAEGGNAALGERAGLCAAYCVQIWPIKQDSRNIGFAETS